MVVHRDGNLSLNLCHGQLIRSSILISRFSFPFDTSISARDSSLVEPRLALLRYSPTENFCSFDSRLFLPQR